MARRRASGEAGTPALRVLTEHAVPHRVHLYGHTDGETSFGAEVVRELAAGGVDVGPDRVFKTLLADVDGALVVAVVPVAAQLDLKALAVAAGGKRAVMADPGRAERSSGYVVGGISPLGQKRALPTFVDAGAVTHPTVFVSAGRRGAQVELAPGDLLALTRGVQAPLAR